ncbi:hypothetical protein [Derxia lacustris]|uniref:hypothetical protein n=1 Tax=Derxia lacustris TaxID=764842 RepID=UPI000A1726C6|nr:hypothetical protein [Derxia lacustris]
MNGKLFSRAVLAAALIASGTAQAELRNYDLSFTSTNFWEPSGIYEPPPVSTVTGSFGITADSLTGTLNSVNSVNLTVAGHTYSLSEIVWDVAGGNFNRIGGALSGAGGTTGGTNDFSLGWVPYRGAAYMSFNYTTPDTRGGYLGGTLSTHITLTEVAAVPEPGAFGLAALGLPLLLWRGRRAARRAGGALTGLRSA